MVTPAGTVRGPPQDGTAAAGLSKERKSGLRDVVGKLLRDCMGVDADARMQKNDHSSNSTTEPTTEGDTRAEQMFARLAEALAPLPPQEQVFVCIELFASMGRVRTLFPIKVGRQVLDLAITRLTIGDELIMRSDEYKMLCLPGRR